MTDIEITKDRSGELMVAQAEGQTDEGSEFLDAYQPDDGQLQVVDSGRIIISEYEVNQLIKKAKRVGLQVTFV